MKAAVRSKYGPSEVLELEIPTPKDNEVLIRVYHLLSFGKKCTLVPNELLDKSARLVRCAHCVFLS